MKQITIYRNKGWFGLARKLKVMVDGAEIETLKAGETKSVTLPAGASEIWGKMDWGKTNIFDLNTLRGGEQLDFNARFTLNPLRNLAIIAKKHMNASGAMHGGCLMTFADFALFTIAHDYIDFYAVTVAFTSEFLSGPVAGQLMEARGEVLKAGRSIIFVRGVITADGVPALNFSGTIKKIKPPQ